MGEHKGWWVREDPRRGTWRAAVLRPGTGKYRTRSFPNAKQARDWAKDEAAGVQTGRPSLTMSTGSGRVLVEELMTDYLAGPVARGRSPSHLANVKRTLGELAKVAPASWRRRRPAA